MNYLVRQEIKIYHILHIDRIASVIQSGGLLSDAFLRTVISECVKLGETNIPFKLDNSAIGIKGIKNRRLNKHLTSHPGLTVGFCVPFYFCPRSVMLSKIHKKGYGVPCKEGQSVIVHLQADFYKTVEWANTNHKRWAFTLSNAGAERFEDRKDITQLCEIDWHAVQATIWSEKLGAAPEVKEDKQAEFLLEESFPWNLVERIGVHSNYEGQQVIQILEDSDSSHKPLVYVHKDWYY
jgi:hypothetical protein